ncbi:hypothetical protein BABINDRAFT_162233 [Babjeviella inositovora NRRL Y-12698]|uniref:FAR1 domain-containing protein n=1 Tax=Babjeviella inositovora NRRL Y-12698 TaxID=984486 RepID=A0A1E3QND4_9ASCO|nr:uncharacterized protein BABINDRAFT_162233 [Babjeviella inositovora NRRL Y-12698]ODQ79193.1 hypothetical protein BABINDRAFT_162233 [Babjeviella inositovora NRRL Y-12698]
MSNNVPHDQYLAQQAQLYNSAPAYQAYGSGLIASETLRQGSQNDVHLGNNLANILMGDGMHLPLATAAVSASARASNNQPPNQQLIEPATSQPTLKSSYKPNQVIAQFPEKEQLKAFVKNTLSGMEKCNVVINSSKSYAIYFTCDKFGNYRTTVKGDRKRNGFSKRVKCPYRLVANYKNDLWILKMVNGEHNHGMIDRSKNSKRGARNKEPIQEAKVMNKLMGSDMDTILQQQQLQHHHHQQQQQQYQQQQQQQYQQTLNEFNNLAQGSLRMVQGVQGQNAYLQNATADSANIFTSGNAGNNSISTLLSAAREEAHGESARPLDQHNYIDTQLQQQSGMFKKE